MNPYTLKNENHFIIVNDKGECFSGHSGKFSKFNIFAHLYKTLEKAKHQCYIYSIDTSLIKEVTVSAVITDSNPLNG